jgi:catechol 2,3-dioxygenase-like lactoylglutathione lyase family enzyme
MAYFYGRLVDHVHLRTADLEASRRFYRAALAALGRSLTWEGDGAYAADELYVSDDGEPTAGIHLAFQAADEKAVQQFYAAALRAGGRDNGSPGLRPQYHSSYYSAYVLDPDGNNVEAVYHGPTLRSAVSISVRRIEPAA